MMQSLSVRLTIAILLVVVVRLISLGAYPLMDTTEARYGEMARIMVDTGNWLTPQFDYGVPFWGKPPMQTWVSAFSGNLFSINEFFLRLPHLISGLLTLAIVGYVAKRKGISPYLSILTLLTTVGFYIASGALMTDSLLALAMTISMVGFYFAWEGHDKNSAYLGFAGIGFGLLIKGPVIIVLIGIAVVPWIITNYGLLEGFRQFWRRIPIFSGLALALIISAPWYLLAEQATPGFLDYFIIGEHWSRFTVSGWEGDLYGSAHDEIKGTIWWYWLYTAFPWSLFAVYLLVNRSKRKQMFEDKVNRRWNSFLLFWVISPMVLFTFAGNILQMYVLPGIPALALFIVSGMQTFRRLEYLLCSITPITVLALITAASPLLYEKSDTALFENIDKSMPVYYEGKPTFSGRYYTLGKALNLNDHKDELVPPYYVVVSKSRMVATNKNISGCNYVSENRKRILVECLGISISSESSTSF
ncbi:ArnT family glycosyltransferase [Vibrio amylolyticus]|uniref:ArnT family glycosyltransferase n=1 Tax=Vibrio amylolyticus TaxID=2847292 RepID=UPI00354F2479